MLSQSHVTKRQKINKRIKCDEIFGDFQSQCFQRKQSEGNESSTRTEFESRSTIKQVNLIITNPFVLFFVRIINNDVIKQLRNDLCVGESFGLKFERKEKEKENA